MTQQKTAMNWQQDRDTRGARDTNVYDQVTRERISRRAFEIFQRRNSEHGRHEDDWFQAERELGLRG
jgi:hypothetical protein